MSSERGHPRAAYHEPSIMMSGYTPGDVAMTRRPESRAIVRARTADSSPLAQAARVVRIAGILLLLMGWFIVVGLVTAATFVRRAVIRAS